MAKVVCKVIAKYAVLSTKEFDRTNWESKNKEKEHVVKTKELRKVQWGDNPAKLEIREWETIDGVERAVKGSGVTFDDEEWAILDYVLSQGLEATA